MRGYTLALVALATPFLGVTAGGCFAKHERIISRPSHELSAVIERGPDLVGRRYVAKDYVSAQQREAHEYTVNVERIVLDLVKKRFEHDFKSLRTTASPARVEPGEVLIRVERPLVSAERKVRSVDASITATAEIRITMATDRRVSLFAESANRTVHYNRKSHQRVGEDEYSAAVARAFDSALGVIALRFRHGEPTQDALGWYRAHSLARETYEETLARLSGQLAPPGGRHAVVAVVDLGDDQGVRTSTTREASDLVRDLLSDRQEVTVVGPEFQYAVFDELKLIAPSQLLDASYRRRFSNLCSADYIAAVRTSVEKGTLHVVGELLAADQDRVVKKGYVIAVPDKPLAGY